ncbi:MAG TPA: GNAT family N-acetyltransferase [Flavobacterium sp.]|nr:GNAT family N-acetyltransferase [Flavobacterium sp.]
MKVIKEIAAAETFPVRHPVLRPGKDIETCHFQGDNLASTKHFGFYIDEELAGIASLFQSATPLISEHDQFQLRGMAVLPDYQKQGIGEALVKFAENDARSRNGKIIWFNAREIAVPFYEKLGYQIMGAPFLIENIGIHFLMHRPID